MKLFLNIGESCKRDAVLLYLRDMHYSSDFGGLKPGEPLACLIDYFQSDLFV